MPLDRTLKSTLKQVVNIASPTSSRTARGDRTFSTPTEICVRIEQDEEIIQRVDGNLRRSTHLVISTDQIREGDRIWLPGVDETDDTLAREVLSVLESPNEKGEIEHYEAKI